jgi:putative transposase
LYQDRYKSFPTESNEYCQTLIRYVEQNPLRAKLVERAEDWQWSSLWRREMGSAQEKKLLAQLPIELPSEYLISVNEVFKKADLALVRNNVNKGKPFGKGEWVDKMVEDHNLGHTVRERGRPRKN